MLFRWITALLSLKVLPRRKSPTMPHYYFVSYSAVERGAKFTGHSVLPLDQPIEFGSDVLELANRIAQPSDRHSVVIHSWQPLKGAERQPAVEALDEVDAKKAEPRYCPELQAVSEGMNALMLEKIDLLRSALDVASMHEFSAELLVQLGRLFELGAGLSTLRYLRAAAQALHSAQQRLG